jgi:Lon protease-like protein
MAQQGKLAAFAPAADWPKHQGPGQVADALTGYLPLPVETKQAILETTDPRERLEKLEAALA